jgi:hypothetical protein
MTRQLVRYLVAIIVAMVVGQITQILTAIFIDIIVGHEVTGGRWSLNIANVILVCIQGCAVGLIAGAIARKRGPLISAISIFLPLLIFLLIAGIKNQDMSDYSASTYDTKPALWIWIALVPAMICGHLSAKIVRNEKLLINSASFYGMASYLCLFAFHLYTTYTAYELAGLAAAAVTLATPPLSDAFWLINIWKSTGVFLNIFTLRLPAVIGAIIFGGIFVGVIGWIEGHTKKSLQMPK